MRANRVKPLEEEQPAPDDHDDLDESIIPGAIPADTDIQEGDEEKDGPDLPPAMPPVI
jgi:hypothetical protein